MIQPLNAQTANNDPNRDMKVTNSGIFATLRKSGLLIIFLSINLMSVLDSASTLFLIGRHQTTEANPVMAVLINGGSGLFLVIKLAITLGGTFFCCYFYQRRKARAILKLVFSSYVVLMGYHCLLLGAMLM